MKHCVDGPLSTYDCVMDANFSRSLCCMASAVLPWRVRDSPSRAFASQQDDNQEMKL